MYETIKIYGSFKELFDKIEGDCFILANNIDFLLRYLINNFDIECDYASKTFARVYYKGHSIIVINRKSARDRVCGIQVKHVILDCEEGHQPELVDWLLSRVRGDRTWDLMVIN